MTDTFEFTLNSPLTEEQWDMMTDVDFDRTDRITFHTKHGKKVEFIKVIRCKDCKWYAHCDDCYGDCMKEGAVNGFVYTNDYCSRAEPKDKP